MGEKRDKSEKRATSLPDAEITFVYLGDKLPRYTVPSLKLLQKYNDVSANFLCLRTLGRKIPKGLADVVPLEDFYSAAKFEKISKSIQASTRFRDGFWHKTFERFFVLEQFSTAYEKPKIFHAELDQIFFGVEKLVSALWRRSERGVYFPFHTATTGIASVFFSNSPDALRSLLDHVLNGQTYPDEMHVLADWAKLNQSQFFGLPTIADYQNQPVIKTIDLGVSAFPGVRGVVDGVQIGQWVAGIDPRNLEAGELARTKFTNAPDSHLLRDESLENLTFTLTEQNMLLVSGGGSSAPHILFNLHLHSKIHPYLARSGRRVRNLIATANRQTKSLVPGAQTRAWLSTVRRIGRVFRKRLAKNVRRFRSILLHQRVQLIRYVGWRPSSKPYLSGDGFRAIADCVWEKQKQQPFDHLPEGSIVFCEGDLVSELAESVRQTPAKSLVLVLGNSDVNHHQIERSLTENGTFRRVYAQNLLEGHPRVAPLPLGLENRFRQNHGLPRNFTQARKNLPTKKPRIMWSFNKNTNPREREAAEKALQRASVTDHVGWLSSWKHLEVLTQYSFVACPSGNGLDTHRVWEALYLECVPIVTRSYPYEYFAALGMPLWILNSFDELESLEEAELTDIYRTFRPKFDSPTLWLPYWESVIRGDEPGQE